MKEIKTIDVVRILQNQGHSVQWRKRTDGGIIITSIDGVKYKAAEGNKRAREITGLALGSARERSLEVINFPGNTKRGRGHKTTDIVDEEIKKQLRRTQRIWRKNRPKTGGVITIITIREKLAAGVSKEDIIEALKQNERYALGIAYSENVRQLVQRLERYLNNNPNEALEKTKDYIKTHESSIREEWIQPIYYEALEPLEKGKISPNSASQLINAIIQNKTK